jgi:hypothetical protein
MIGIDKQFVPQLQCIADRLARRTLTNFSQ